MFHWSKTELTVSGHKGRVHVCRPAKKTVLFTKSYGLAGFHYEYLVCKIIVIDETLTSKSLNSTKKSGSCLNCRILGTVVHLV